MSDIFREVNEEVRQDQAKALWNKYGIYVMAFAAVIVLGVSGYKGWQYYSLKQAEKAGAEYFKTIALVDSGKDKEALDAFGILSKQGSTGFFLLSKFQEAGIAAKVGNSDDAVAIFDELAANTSLDDSLRNLARLRAGLLLSNTANLKEVENRIGELAKAGNPWRHTAMEVLAATAYRTGDLVKADQLFNELSADPATPNAMRTRAAAMISIITPKLPVTSSKQPESKPDAQ